MIELERTYLAKNLPKDLEVYPKKEVFDLYIPESHPHPVIRLRKNGDKYEMTKKEPVSGSDSSIQEEQTIALEKDEFDALLRVQGRALRKIRYNYKKDGFNFDLDVFKDRLEGLVVVDIEFEKEKDKDSFVAPDFCLKDVTQEKFIAGGMLAGKSYEDIEKNLKNLGYKKILE
jgi:CYTH domain-containing protein